MRSWGGPLARLEAGGRWWRLVTPLALLWSIGIASLAVAAGRDGLDPLDGVGLGAVLAGAVISIVTIGRLGRARDAPPHPASSGVEDRRGVRDALLNLARRNQALLHRQLGLLDAMERRTTDADELAELFAVDHLATRMRRNAENLIVLSGANAGRVWRRPVPLVDIVRAAVAEVEDYTRVSVPPLGATALAGRAVGDVIHLLAELIENAVSFSPPEAVVRVSGALTGNGFAIEIEDRGLGLPEPDRRAINERLRQPGPLELTGAARLGHYVVGALAARHGIRVQLTESPYGGVTAIVLLPSALVTEEVAETIEAGPVAGAGDRAGGQRGAGRPPSGTEPPLLTPSGLPVRQRPARLERPGGRAGDRAGDRPPDAAESSPGDAHA